PHPRPRVLPGAVRRSPSAVQDPLHLVLEEADVDLLVLEDVIEVGPDAREEPGELEAESLVAVEVDRHRVPLLRELGDDGLLPGLLAREALEDLQVLALLLLVALEERYGVLRDGR